MKLVIKRNRFWIEIIALASGIAFAVALLIATLGAALSFTGEPAVGQEVESPAPPQARSVVRPAKQDLPQIDGSATYEGMVTCSQCGAKHAAKMGESAADCTRNCVRTGAATFSLVNGDKVYQLGGDMNILKKVAGTRARVVGMKHGNTIEVSALAEI